MKKIIRYKVVRGDGRNSCFVNESKLLNLVYKNGTIVKAKRGTCGVMVFDSYYHAEDFRKSNLRLDLIILKVEAIGKRMITPYRLLDFQNINWEEMKTVKRIKERLGIIALTFRIMWGGVECYHSVRVIRKTRS